MKSLLSILKEEDQIVSKINAINKDIENIEREYERSKAYQINCAAKLKHLAILATKRTELSNIREECERELVPVRDELRLYFAALSVRLL